MGKPSSTRYDLAQHGMTQLVDSGTINSFYHKLLIFHLPFPKLSMTKEQKQQQTSQLMVGNVVNQHYYRESSHAQLGLLPATHHHITVACASLKTNQGVAPSYQELISTATMCTGSLALMTSNYIKNTNHPS